jgi:hypothetical protein
METKETITRKEATDLDQTLYLLAKRDLSYNLSEHHLQGIGEITTIFVQSTNISIFFIGNKVIKGKRVRSIIKYILYRTRKALEKANNDLKGCNRIVKEAEVKIEKRPLEIRMLKVLKDFIQEQGVLIAELEEIQDLHERYLSIFKKVENNNKTIEND